jgi:hypothetical protein
MVKLISPIGPKNITPDVGLWKVTQETSDPTLQGQPYPWSMLMPFHDALPPVGVLGYTRIGAEPNVKNADAAHVVIVPLTAAYVAIWFRLSVTATEKLYESPMFCGVPLTDAVLPEGVRLIPLGRVPTIDQEYGATPPEAVQVR